MAEPKTERAAVEERRRGLSRSAFSILDDTESLVGQQRVVKIAELCDGDCALLAECLSLLRHELSDGPVPRMAGEKGNNSGAVGRSDAVESLNQARPMHAGGAIGGWTLVGLIGRGATGEVWRAERHGGPPAALKIIPMLGMSPRAYRQLEAETDALARCDHPGIARVLGSGREMIAGAERAFVVMELIEGAALTRAAEAANLPWRQRVELLALVCDAVAHAHERGVIHRDLKPANVLVGPDLRPRVIDFGTARLAPPDGAASDSFGGGAVLVGTLPYAAPEQLGGDGGDVRADVHALGVMGYELLAGRLPVDVSGLDIVSALRACAEASPPRLRSVRSRIPRSLDAVIHRAMARERERRYASAGGLAEDLRRALAGRPTNAHPMGLFEWLVELWRQRPRFTASIGGALVVLAAGAAAGQLILSRAHRAELREAEARATHLSALSEDAARILEQVRAGASPDAGALADISRRFSDLAEADPLDPRGRRLLALVTQALGDDALTRRDLKGCIAIRESVLGQLGELSAADPENVELRMDLSVATVKLADVLREAREPAFEPRAEFLYARALETDEAIFAANQGDRRACDNLLRSYVRASHHAREAGRPDESIRSALRAIELSGTLGAIARAEPMTSHARFDAFHAMACTLEATGRLDEAAEHEWVAFEAAKAYWNLVPGSAHAHATLSSALSTLSRLAGDTISEGDLLRLGEAARLLWLASHHAPHDVARWQDAGLARQCAIDVHLRLGKLDDAADLLSRTADEAAPFAGRSVLMLRTLASCAIDLTHDDLRGGRGAGESARRALAHLRTIADTQAEGTLAGAQVRDEARVLAALVEGFMVWSDTRDEAACLAAIDELGDPDQYSTSPPGLAWAARSYLFVECGRRDESDSAQARYRQVHPSADRFNWLQIRERW